MSQELKHTARWVDNCQGKKDFDGYAVLISARSYPGTLTIYDPKTPEKGLHEILAGKPSALASLDINHGEPEYGYGDHYHLIEQRFEAETEEEVRQQVEEWVQRQFDRMVSALRKEFDETPAMEGENTFGEHLRTIRNLRGWSQRRLASTIGVDFSYLSKIETGNLPPPSTDVIHRLAQALETDEDELLALAGKHSISAMQFRIAALEKKQADMEAEFKAVLAEWKRSQERE